MAVVIGMVAAPRPADAGCLATPDLAACRPWSAVLLPSAFVTSYLPSNHSGVWSGGGLEAVVLAWSDSAPSFGPSHGKVRIDVGALASSGADHGAMAMYRLGVELSVERSAARSYLIPFVVTDVGGLWTAATHSRAFVDAGLGLYLVHQRSLIVALEVDGVLPFSDPGALGGGRAQLTGSFALW